ncbi:kinase-like protein [Gigaspora margarita]|uniref:Kinase-like protein n=1 Tax=Gigaspora margarita TaxID=4874 RepID=A0A8H4EV89_GIGMA|nr:kinase-like protein [Gigaspora margarita]
MLEKHIESCDYNEFYDSEMIYEGNYSYIHKAKWKNGIPVVLKFSKNIENSDTLQTFEMVQKLCYHPNIIEYYAITSDPPCIGIVMQFAEGGDLRHYLKKKFSNLRPTDKLRIAKEIVLGIEFLHNNNIIHADLHTKNILVHKGKMMIADFDHSIFRNSESIERDVRGNLAFTDPQALNSLYKFTYTPESDIYSLSVILWEISSGHMPFEDMLDEQIIIHVLKGRREKPTYNMPSEYIKLYKHGWNENPTNRPEVNDILEVLEQCILKKNYEIMVK